MASLLGQIYEQQVVLGLSGLVAECLVHLVTTDAGSNVGGNVGGNLGKIMMLQQDHLKST